MIMTGFVKLLNWLKHEEAEAATLTAICDRLDAEAAHGNSKKHS
jgi:hypothetical protein